MASRSISSRASLPPELVAPGLFCVLMILGAAIACAVGHVSYAGLLLPYLAGCTFLTGLAAGVTVLCWVIQLARRGEQRPLANILGRLQERGPLLLVAFVLVPLFYVNYSGAKAAIPFTVGYSWDPFWTKADELLFGTDAWRISAAILPTPVERIFEFLYGVVWGTLLLLINGLVCMNASRKRASQFYAVYFATWFIGGFVLAYLLSAAGPVYADLTSSGMDRHFAALTAMLQQRLMVPGPVQLTEAYLAAQYGNHLAMPGAGISAMPSMHIAVVTIYVLFARRTIWLVPASMLWIVVFIFSSFSGYHYWCDAIVSVVMTVGCWAAAARFLERPENRARLEEVA